MNKRIKNALIALKSNKGSSVVTVIVAMLFISILGAALLFATYTGLVVKVTEREGKQNFYTAEESMEIIRSGFQQMANEALIEAYNEAYTRFSYFSLNDDFEHHFSNIYKRKIFENDFEGLDFEGAETTDGTFRYSGIGADPSTDIAIAGTEAITNMYMSDIEAYYLSVVGTGVTLPVISNTLGDTDSVSAVTVEEDKIIIRGITVESRDPQTNIVTTITSDIVINMPDFAYAYAPYNVSTIPEFAFIVDETFTPESVGVKINGSTYMGNYVATSGDVTATNGAMITSNDGEISISNNSRLTINPSLTLWTDGIAVNDSILSLAGDAYVQDDLTLGRGAYVNITGNYTGFSSSTTDPEKSSAILVNGIESSLVLQGAESLTLAGRGFIGAGASSLQTSESLAVRSNQTLYLVPHEMIVSSQPNFSNPYVFTSGVAPSVSIDSTSAPWPGYIASNYGTPGITTRTYALNSGGNIAYYFFDFNSQENADKFFEDYFANKPESVEYYLNQYLDYDNNDITDFTVNTDNVSADGYILNNDLDVLETLTAPAVATVGNTTTFENLSSTLSNVPPTSADQTPYTSIVDIDAINDFIALPTSTPDADGNYIFKAGGSGNEHVVAILVYGKTAVNLNDLLTNYPNLAFILAYTEGDLNCDITATNITGNVFEGLIITDGNLTVNGSVEFRADATEVTNALSAIDDGSGTNSGYLVSFGTGDSTIGASSDDTWDLNEIVQYENWTKK